MSKNFSQKDIANGFYPLRQIQSWLINTHFNKVNSTMMNITAFSEIDNSIDLEKLSKAINETVAAHDIFKTRFVVHPETGEICQRFDGEIFPVEVEKFSDAEFDRRKKNLLQPYKLIDSPLYRIFLFETPSGKFIYLDFYHAIIDGVSIAFIFSNEVEMRYKNKKILHEPSQYADYILEEMKISPEELSAGNKFFHEITASFDAKKHLPPADLHRKENWQENHFKYQIKNISADYFKKNNRTENIFFIAASMMAIAKSSGAKNFVMSWIHSGRINSQELRIMGLMMEQFPISFDFEKNITVKKFLDSLEEKIAEELKYRKSLGAVYREGLQDNFVTFMFQKNIRNQDSSDTFSGRKMKYSAAENILDIELNALDDGNYLIDLDYDASRYSKDAMKNFAETMDEIILQLQDEKIFIHEILNRN